MILKILAPLIFLAEYLVFPGSSFGSSNLEISNSSSFKELKTSFSANENIYLRVKSDLLSAQKQDLNIRDNTYKLLKTLKLEKSGNYFQTNFKAPENEGTYSLEAQIEEGGSRLTSVKTIRVGAFQNSSNVKINVSQSTSSESSKENASEESSSNSENSEPQQAAGVKEANVLERIFSLLKSFFTKSFWNSSN